MSSLAGTLLLVAFWLIAVPTAARSEDVPPPLPTPAVGAVMPASAQQSLPYQPPQYQPVQYQTSPDQAAPNQAVPNPPAPYQAGPYQAGPIQPGPYQPAPTLPAPGSVPYVAPAPVPYAAPPPGAVIVAPGQPVYAYPPPGPYGGPVVMVSPAPPREDYNWSATVDALFLERSVGSNARLGVTAYNPSSHLPPLLHSDELHADDASFPLAAGARVELSKKLDDRVTLAGTYWGLQQWSIDSEILADPYQDTVLAYSPYLQLTSLLSGLDDSLSYKYDSKIENVELNALIRLSPYDPYAELDWIVGARYVYLADHFSLTGVDNLNSATETLDYSTTNNLVGAQTGLLFTHGWSRYQWELGAKFGLMANMYHQHGTDSASETSGTPAGFTPYDTSNSGSTLSGLFELSFAARYRLSDTLWLRIGYQFYDITNVALGPRQLNSWSHGGNVMLDGISIGLQATF